MREDGGRLSSGGRSDVGTLMRGGIGVRASCGADRTRAGEVALRGLREKRKGGGKVRMESEREERQQGRPTHFPTNVSLHLPLYDSVDGEIDLESGRKWEVSERNDASKRRE